MGLTALILSVLILTYTVYFYFKRWQFFRNCKNIQTRPIIPLLGNLLDVINIKDIRALTFYGAGNDFKRRASWYGPLLAIVFQTADDVKALLQSKNYNKSFMYDSFQLFGNLGVGTCIIENGWKSQRHVLNHLFRPKLIEQWIPSLNKHTQNLIQVWEKKAATGEFFDAYPYTFRIACDTAIEFVAGIQWNLQISGDVNEHFKIFDRFMLSVAYKMMRPYLSFFPFSYIWGFTAAGKRHQKYAQDLYNLVSDIFERGYKKEDNRISHSFDNENNVINLPQEYEPLPVVSYLKQAQKKDPQFWTEKRMTCTMNETLFAAFDTVDSALANLLYIFGSHPEAQEKAYQEIKLVFGDDKTREANEEDLKKLNYLECCIKEGLRMLPSGPVILRELSSPLTLADGDLLPKGTVIVLPVYTLHRNPNVYPEPNKFKPERFDVTNLEAQNRSQYDYLTFSGGARGCAGISMAFTELKVMLSTILRNFRIESKSSFDELECSWKPLLKPTNAFVKLHCR